jgi:benzoate-CoA ligase
VEKAGFFNVASELLEENASVRGDKVAILCGEERVTYKELLENVNRFANILEGLKVPPAQRVLIALPDSPFWLYAFLGSIKYGAWPVPVNTMLKEEDYRYMLEDSEARVLVTTKDHKSAGVKMVPFHYTLLADNGIDSLMSHVPPQAKAYPAHKDDIAFWLYSSGSTGRPKGIPHRHVDMIHSADNYAKKVIGMEERDVCFSVSKLFFAYGLGNGLAFPLRCGASVVQLSAPPSPGAVVATVARYRPTLFFGVPTQYNSVLKRPETDEAFASVRMCMSAGEALPPEIFNKWRALTGLEILDGIGSTEALHIFISNRAGGVRPGTSGCVVPGYEAKIVDENGVEVPPGEPGNLIIRGESVTRGYWNRPEENAEKILPGGWFKTGDVYARKDGYFSYAGRGDDMLKVGGIWVSPVEIENVLMEHEAVNEAAVVGREVEGLVKPFGYVTLNEGFKEQDRDWEPGEELIQFVSRRLPRFKWLREVQVLDELPKTSTGKIQRFKLRA